MGRSLRFRLTASLLAVLGLVFGCFSILLYAFFGRALWTALDERLRTEAEALADMVNEHSKETFKFEFEGISVLPDFSSPSHPAYFQVWRPNGSVLSRSPSLAWQADAIRRDLHRHPDSAAEPRFWRGELPDGRDGRFIQVSLFGQWKSRSVPEPPSWRRRLTVMIARDTAHEDAALARLRFLLWGLGALSLAVAAGAAAYTISRGLRPATALAAEIGRMDATHLGERIAVADLPPELEPPVGKLNELLARLDESFARERRFTSDVSHELRTPLAGLRSLLEVAASRDRAAPDYRATLREALGIVRQMSGMVENLLMLARVDARQIELDEEPIPLWEFAAECFRPYAGRAAERGLTFRNRVDPAAVVRSDRAKLQVVVTNLLSNAVDYTEARGRIEVRGGGGDDGLLLEVWDSGPQIPGEVLPRLFERFFRADSARAGGGLHCGIGLALVDALSRVLGLEASAENAPDGGVCFRLARPVKAAPRERTPTPAPVPGAIEPHAAPATAA